MKEELKSYIEECSCDIVQKKWKPKFRDVFYCKSFYPKFGLLVVHEVENDTIRCIAKGENRVGKDGFFIPNLMNFPSNPAGHYGNLVFLPSLEQLIAMMGWGRFHKMFNGWFEQERPLDLLDRSTQKLKLACIKVVKEIKTENK